MNLTTCSGPGFPPRAEHVYPIRPTAGRMALRPTLMGTFDQREFNSLSQQGELMAKCVAMSPSHSTGPGLCDCSAH